MSLLKKKAPKIVEKKLGREKALGQHECGSCEIEIDPRQSSRDRMGTVIHETLHYIMPRLSETKVLEIEKVLTEALWKDRYRRVEQ